MHASNFDVARALVREGRLLEARALLATIDHPQATVWIAKIDQRMQHTSVVSHRLNTQVVVQPVPPRVKAAPSGGTWMNNPMIVTGVTVLGMALVVLLLTLGQRGYARIVSMVVTTAPATTRMPAQVAHLPGATTPLGTRANPIPYTRTPQVTVGLHDIHLAPRGYYDEEGLALVVLSFSLYNTTPRAGERYVLIPTILYCDRASDESCEVFSSEDFQLRTHTGTVYEPVNLALDGLERFGDVQGRKRSGAVISFILPAYVNMNTALLVYQPQFTANTGQLHLEVGPRLSLQAARDYTIEVPDLRY